jgi:VWFA-related protein
MRIRQVGIWRAILRLLAAGSIASSAAAIAQQPGETSSAEVPTIKSETRLVLVDTVVTDKKGNYIRDLTAKDFKLWEDNKEQPITSFALEDDAAATATSQRRYLVLFFDNSTMDASEQVRARQAAAKFIDANSGPNHLIAVVDFGGSVRIAQNFTADAQRLKQVVSGVKTSAVSPNAGAELASLASPPAGAMGIPNLGGAEADFGVQSMMLALRTLAKNLSSVPGRKTLVLLTSGFPLTPEHESELTAAIDACNKANVAIYPIDVRGLVAASNRLGVPPGMHRRQVMTASVKQDQTPRPRRPHLLLASLVLAAEAPQHPTGGGGGGGTGGGGGGRGGVGGTGGTGTGGRGGTGGGTTGGRGGTTTGGGTTGGRGGTTTGGGTTGGRGGTTTGGGGGRTGGTGSGGYSGNPAIQNPYTQSRQIVPQFPESASNNQQVMYALATGTGGFVILNTNDLLGGLEKIAQDQSEYYSLGFKPNESLEGSCHTLRVKVERGGTQVRSRSGYCNVKPKDLLAGNAIEKTMESRATSEMPANTAAALQAPFFYTSANTARVNLAMDIPSSAIKFSKEKGKQHAAVNVLGIAYRADNSIAARFSDTANLDFEDKKDLQEFEKHPFHYENQFDVAPGEYSLRVVFNSGSESFGKVVVPLSIDAYDGKKLSLSGLALSNQVHPATDISTGLDAELLEDRKPLVVRGLRIVPAGSTHFKKTDNLVVYSEAYAPALLTANPPEVGFEFVVMDRKTGEKKVDAGIRDTSSAIQAGSMVMTLGLKIPTDQLSPGSYRVELRAVDSLGQSTGFRSADFELE